MCEALTDKTAKAKAKELRSTLTYDLIAVNKASRPQFRNIAKPASEQVRMNARLGLEEHRVMIGACIAHLKRRHHPSYSFTFLFKYTRPWLL